MNTLRSASHLLATLIMLPATVWAGIDREEEMALFRRAVAELREGRASEALDLLPRCEPSSGEPGEEDCRALISWRLFVHLGEVLLGGGDVEGSARALERASECSAGTDLSLELAEAYAEAGKRERALRLLSDLDALSPAARPRGLALSARLLEEMGEREAARSLHMRLLLEHPAHPAAEGSEGRLLDLSEPGDSMPSDEERVARLERLNSAHHNERTVASAEQLLPLLPEGGDLWCRASLLLGVAHRKARSYREAIEVLSRVMDVCGRQEEVAREASWTLSSATWILEGEPAIPLLRRHSERWPEAGRADEALYL
ncbi:MAG: tetratricopeptide repeat protein, partial [Myxococcota bacterium]